MFRLIGLAVVVFVIFISWDSLTGLWKGDLSGEEAASAIRKDVGKAISEPRNNEATPKDKGAASAGPRQDAEEKPSGPRSVEQLADDLLRKK
jgi:hypothetical protein